MPSRSNRPTSFSWPTPTSFDPSGALPIAPYESDSSKWGSLPWIDRRTGEQFAITTEPLDGHVRPGVVLVPGTTGQMLTDYLAHPEAKSLGPEGEPVGRHTVGLLRRRPVAGAIPVLYIGKEANRLEDRITGLVASPDEYRTEIRTRAGQSGASWSFRCSRPWTATPSPRQQEYTAGHWSDGFTRVCARMPRTRTFSRNSPGSTLLPAAGNEGGSVPQELGGRVAPL